MCLSVTVEYKLKHHFGQFAHIKNDNLIHLFLCDAFVVSDGKNANKIEFN